MNNGKKLVLSALLLALVQVGFLGWMIVGRAAVLRDGREVLLKVEPVDPRDLLRGDYVILNYDISRLPLSMIADIGEVRHDLVPTHSVTVRLRREEDGYWRAGGAWLKTPPNPAGADEVDIVGQVPSLNLAHVDGEVRVTYGIERFYVPEGEGRAIERDMRVRPFGVRAAVSSSGTAQVKALMDGENMLFEEPLY
ncbi:GDYXXLXY domain-containing protein [Aquamicrobium terrae]|uniref:Membrane-anchored protein n=1 Tax=Aquamicrobium terrae TaxID=1324945 RepID=A0ABV2N0J7_9HYPH